MKDLLKIARCALDASPHDMEKHDAQHHPNGFDPSKDTCKYRESLAKGDNSDTVAKQKPLTPAEKYPGGLVGRTIPIKPDGKEMKKVVHEFELSSHPRIAAAYLRLDHEQEKAFVEAWDAVSARCRELSNMSKEDRHDAIHNPPKGEIPVTREAYRRWKKDILAKTESQKKKDKKSDGGVLPDFLAQSGSSGSWTKTGGSNLSQYFHSQGKKQYSNKLHKPTGLYETMRPGGPALAREEDVPGKTAFHSKRPSFYEIGDVPDSLTKEQLSHFRYTANGSTYPMVGNVDGRNYIVKRGFEKARKNENLTDHIKKEVAADRFICAAGLNAPVCNTFELERDVSGGVKIDEKKLKELFDCKAKLDAASLEKERIWADDNATVGQYKASVAAEEKAKTDLAGYEDSLGKEKKAYSDTLKSRTKDGKLAPAGEGEKELFKIAEYVNGGVSLVRSWKEGSKKDREKIRQQVIDAYPIMSFLENVDAFKNDNVLCDKDNNLWFVDNGACFDYRAQGGKKLKSVDKRGYVDRMSSSGDPWYYERDDPFDYDTGFFGLLYAPDQKLLQEILEDVKDDELVKAARKYDFPALVKTLPPDMQRPGLVAYAQKLQDGLANPPEGWPAPVGEAPGV